MVLLSLDAGMPVREIAELTIADVWNEDGTVKTTVFWPRKNDHISKLSSNMRKEVFSYLIGIDRSDMTAPLFGTQKREAFNANTLCQHFFWIYKKAGIEASSHSGRKTYLKRLENV
jgi:integrase/recombinase XerD